MTVENDTEVFYEVRVEPLTGEHIYTDRTGTRAAIRKSGRKLDPMSKWFCPHQWLDADGFVSQELANQFPLSTHRSKFERATEAPRRPSIGGDDNGRPRIACALEPQDLKPFFP